MPAWETLPHERLSPRSDTIGRRLQVLRAITGPAASRPRIVVAPVRAVIQPIVSGIEKLEPVHLVRGEEYPFKDVVRGLNDAAYSRVDLVAKRGEYAVRGGIIDVFPPTATTPVRLEFFGDELDEMRHFSVADQRTLSGGGRAHRTHPAALPRATHHPRGYEPRRAPEGRLPGRRIHARKDCRRHLR